MKQKSISFIIAAVFISFLVPQKILAIGAPEMTNVGCVSGDKAQVSALVKVTENTPVLYVRASLPEQQSLATVYFQTLTADTSAPCIEIGKVLITKNWQNVGTFPATAVEGVGILSIVFENATSTIGAGGPQAVFASTNSPCALGESCSVVYRGADFELSPKKVSSASDSLKVGVLNDPGSEAIRDVIYSIDGVQAYAKKTIEPFNLRYVPGGTHSVERTIVLASGQSLSDKKTITKGTFGDVGYLFTSITTRYSKIIILFGGVLGVLALWSLIFFFLKMLHKRRLWRATHIVGAKVGFNAKRAGPQPQSMFEDSTLDILKKHKKAIGGTLSGIALLFVIFSFVLTVFTVDGISMDPTLVDKTKRPLFVLPSVFGKVTGNGYTPGRGTIVVIEKDDNNLFSDTAVKQKEYVVKRVVALPNERVVMSNGEIKVYNYENPDGFVPDSKFGWIKNVPKLEFIRLDITLQQGELFVMGDNRDNSIDSRFYGPVKASQIVGKVL